jgi:hypothetical protein
VREVRKSLLELHQTLLATERKSYEKVHGRVSSGELLQLVINNSQFAWLRIISALVVQIDEMLDADEPVTGADTTDLIAGLANCSPSLRITNSSRSIRLRCKWNRKW